MKKIRKAIIPAAGLGTRFLPATKAMPKEMLPIVDKPTIQYIVEEAIASGIEDIIIVTGKGKRAIEDHFDHAFELEANLIEKRNTIYWKRCVFPPTSISTISVKNSLWALAMPSGAPANLSGTNLLLFCSEMILSKAKCPV